MADRTAWVADRPSVGAGLLAALLFAVAMLSGCDERQAGEPTGPAGSASPQLSMPDEVTVVLTSDAAADPGSGGDGGLSVAMSQQLYTHAPVLVVASAGEQLRAASAAIALGVPALVDGPGVAAEVERLGAEVVLAIGAVADPGVEVVRAGDDAQLAELLGVPDAPVPSASADAANQLAAVDRDQPQLLVPGPADSTGPAASTADPTATEPASSGTELPSITKAAPLEQVTVLTTGSAADLAAIGTAKAAGATVLVTPTADPRASSDSVQALAADPPAVVIGLGPEFGDAQTLGRLTQTAATGVELPGGGQLALPGKTYVALYGTPSTGALGVLGEQSPEATIERAQEHASAFEPHTGQPVVPTLEIIATIASASATPDGNYSIELPVSELTALVDLAEQHGLYVVLDLQPGRTDFVTQAKLYEELLVRPHVGLALDPEWRLGPNEQHLVKIGSVSVDEVNAVVTWLADLTAAHNLPQKILVLHMFQNQMIPGVDAVDQTRPEVAVLIHADGQGGQGAKQATWGALRDYAPSVLFWGWKNFYDEDSPMLNPGQTMSQVAPAPDFVSYQ